MIINKTVNGNSLVIKVDGRLDTMTAPELESVLGSSITGITDLQLDLTDLAYISSAGLRVLLKTQKMMDGQGKMTVKNPNEAIMEIFDITGFSDILNIEQTAN